MRKGGKTEKRLKRLLWRIRQPAEAENFGVRLPLTHAAITAPIRKDIYFGGYESKEAELVAARIAPDDVVMEVGAGIGFLSTLCAKVVGSDQVFAYEANPQLIEIIRAVHALNGVAPSITNALLAKGDGERDFYLEQDYWASSLIRGSAAATAIRVRQIDLNGEIRRIRPSFLIVDIEGGEYEFFRDIDLAPVRKICIETHPHVLGDRHVSELLGWLIAAGFALDFGLMRKNVYYLYRADD
jgi:FkbM family methyltransferase